MTVKGKAAEVEVVIAAAVAVGGRKLWPAICHRENLTTVVAVATMGTIATVVIPALVVTGG